MPSPDGYEICRFLKNSSGLRQIPVVIISAKGAKDDIDRVFSLGAEAYLPKPFSIDQLLYVVNRWAHRGGSRPGLARTGTQVVN